MQLDFTGLNQIPTTAEQPQENPQQGGLQREADQRAENLRNAADVYRKYQENIRATEILQAQILTGIRAGENIYSLFLKAVKALSLTVNDNLLFTQASEELQQHYPEAQDAQQL